jgi:hypothetical protein
MSDNKNIITKNSGNETELKSISATEDGDVQDADEMTDESDQVSERGNSDESLYADYADLGKLEGPFDKKLFPKDGRSATEPPSRNRAKGVLAEE